MDASAKSKARRGVAEARLRRSLELVAERTASSTRLVR